MLKSILLCVFTLLMTGHKTIALLYTDSDAGASAIGGESGTVIIGRFPRKKFLMVPLVTSVMHISIMNL
ncbi:hypothetical protein EIL50_03160 [bacterium NHP-B]|nr:hypothetical protein EIL50_03160 [bacterium NHP-B]